MMGSTHSSRWVHAPGPTMFEFGYLQFVPFLEILCNQPEILYMVSFAVHANQIWGLEACSLTILEFRVEKLSLIHI